jgi:hypothetical protein
MNCKATVFARKEYRKKVRLEIMAAFFSIFGNSVRAEEAEAPKC